MVTILILIDGFLQCKFDVMMYNEHQVTILILIDGFLQFPIIGTIKIVLNGHNPYFNRWFSAIDSVGS